MNAQDMFAEFMKSDHGRQAIAVLSAKGLSDVDAEASIEHAMSSVAHDHVNDGSGILGTHPGQGFLAGFATGLIKGDGLWGSMKDGLEGMMGGRIAEAIADKTGLDKETASLVTAALTPLLVSFVETKIAH